MLFPTVHFPTPCVLLCPKIGVRNPHPKLQSLLCREGVKLRTSNLASTFIGSIRTKTHEQFWRKGSVAYPGTAQFFRVPPIISGTGKATKFKFCTHIYRLYWNKNTLKMSRKADVGVVRDSKIFRAPILGRIARSSLR